MKLLYIISILLLCNSCSKKEEFTHLNVSSDVIHSAFLDEKNLYILTENDSSHYQNNLLVFDIENKSQILYKLPNCKNFTISSDLLIASSYDSVYIYNKMSLNLIEGIAFPFPINNLISDYKLDNKGEIAYIYSGRSSFILKKKQSNYVLNYPTQYYMDLYGKKFYIFEKKLYTNASCFLLN